MTYSNNPAITPSVQEVLHPGYDPATWYGSVESGAVSITVAVAADVLYFCPIQIMRRSSWVSIGIRVGTAVPGVSGKLALYGNGDMPTGNKQLLAAGVGTVDMNATAGTSVALNFASTMTLDPGWYWVVSLFDGVAQPNCMNQAAIAAHSLAPQLGAPTVAGAIGIVSSLSYIRYSAARPYALGFPALVSSLSRSVNNPGSPIGALLTAS